MVHAFLTEVIRVDSPFPEACVVGWRSPYRTYGVSCGYSGFTTRHKTIPKLKIFKREPNSFKWHL
ncbi:hypothetical protein DPMN_150432 [Dreissena polymorpha]|uniref:Uncharacterized protein n=1 Tax=Dreissena polymorpha TaxID=45954 RepID=A0A9D4FEL0_DREPO|nr:hypothetical protein DPMN_150432 [Dreissena polymorpha]